jgi:preprotein translocase subunit SecE
MAQPNLLQYFREVRQEALKVTWPTRRETAISTAMVVVMVLLSALFFFFVDEILAIATRFLLTLGA